MHRFAATLICTALLTLPAAVGHAKPAAQNATACTGKSLQQMVAELPGDRQAAAQKLFNQYSVTIHKLVEQEKDARKALDAVLTDTAATPEAVEQKTRELIESQGSIIRERVAFRMHLAAETGIRLPFQMSGAGVGLHGSGCGDDGDCPGSR